MSELPDLSKLRKPLAYDEGKIIGRAVGTTIKVELKVYPESWIILTTDQNGNSGCAAYGPIGSVGLISNLMEKGGAIYHGGNELDDAAH